MVKVLGVVFDKDGTLFDFNATWGAWARRMIQSEANGDPQTLAALTEVLGFDLERDRFRRDSIVIAETGETVAEHIRRVLPHLDVVALRARMNAAAMMVRQVEAAPLAPLFDRLRDMGLALGIATNDAEVPARAHLDRAGLSGRYDFLAGYDTGFGAKPGPGQLEAFLARTGLRAQDCVMVGDSLHDLHAARSAGFLRVGVLTGPATREDLTPHADAVLQSIAELPNWLSAVRGIDLPTADHTRT